MEAVHSGLLLRLLLRLLASAPRRQKDSKADQNAGLSFVTLTRFLPRDVP